MSLHNPSGRYTIAAQEDRSAPRTRILIPAQLRFAGMQAFQTTLIDLSLSGFCAIAITRVHPATICWLTLPGLESLQAEVVWWEDGKAGCALARLLSPVVLDNILARFRQDGGIRD